MIALRKRLDEPSLARVTRFVEHPINDLTRWGFTSPSERPIWVS